jgi:hypothetical protein
MNLAERLEAMRKAVDVAYLEYREADRGDREAHDKALENWQDKTLALRIALENAYRNGHLVPKEET